ncbi:MAG: AAA family ATPase, partial [Rhodothermaceae bacterium]|nr:AAA family ATPase [Rhodothermaceae bacterium]
MKLKATHFQVLNYRNIDDSGLIPLEKVTAFVGRNEAGKTALLKALHKFNPATEEPYNPQREFPRDRFTAEFEDGGAWPVCRVIFKLSPEFREELRSRLGGAPIPKKVILTRYYDGSLQHEYKPEVSDNPIDPNELVMVLNEFAKDARRLSVTQEYPEEDLRLLRTQMAGWAEGNKESAETLEDLRSEQGINLVEQVHEESNQYSAPVTADIVETLQNDVSHLRARANEAPFSEQLEKAVAAELPVFIYFENYGILDSSVYLPRFLEDLGVRPEESRIRTINAMFRHVKLTAQEISDLGREETKEALAAGEQVTEEMMVNDQARKELRSIKLNSASLDISRRFSEWFGQRRHKVRYQADGPYFRIWVSDDRRQDVDIELESRSKGFQWFFSFYLVFLVESDEGHKDAILLLDEPGLHLHPTAQQELLAFFEKLSEKNPLIYTTHSPFLIDGEHIHRVRPVTEDDQGHSRISIDGWPKDHETLFPLQAAAGYAMIQGLFRHRKNLLVEGISDYFYLHALNLYCRALGLQCLPDDIYITPCGGTKYVGKIASLFLGKRVRPIVLLDGDEAGRTRRDALFRELYVGREEAVLMLSDVLGQDECEIEDLIAEPTILHALNRVVQQTVRLNQNDRSKGSLVTQIKSAANRSSVNLPEGWKAEVARNIVVEWSTAELRDIPKDVIERAEMLF